MEKYKFRIIKKGSIWFLYLPNYKFGAGYPSFLVAKYALGIHLKRFPMI